jgi:hypothetical protein
MDFKCVRQFEWALGFARIKLKHGDRQNISSLAAGKKIVAP